MRMPLDQFLQSSPLAWPAFIEAHCSGMTSPELPVGEGRDPVKLCAGLLEFAQLAVQLAEEPEPVTPEAADELGGYALVVLRNLIAAIGHTGDSEDAQNLQDLAMSIALWMYKNGADIADLEPVVNAIAVRANELQETGELIDLSDGVARLIHGVSEEIRADEDSSDDMRPWRILLLNHAIIATRTHDPDRMRAAYDLLVEALPEEANSFFSEAMSQMQRMDYPPPVSELVQTYFQAHSGS